MRLALSIFLVYGICSCTVVNHADNVLGDNRVNNVESTTKSSNENASEKIPLPDGIRTIDFGNFTYDWFPKYGDITIKKKITLQNKSNSPVHIEGPGVHPLGEDYEEFLANVAYADLTGDGKEEAIVTVGVKFYRWTPQCIFIYTLKTKNPALLWRYETDTFGKNLSLRGFKIENGALIIEEYDTEYGSPAICCPLRYFRKTFAWNGKTLELKNNETIPYDKDHRELTGYPAE